MAINTTGPEHAEYVASCTASTLRELRSAPSADVARNLTASWRAWADANRVCRPIREHMTDAGREVQASFKAREPKREIRNPAGADQ